MSGAAQFRKLASTSGLSKHQIYEAENTSDGLKRKGRKKRLKKVSIPSIWTPRLNQETLLQKRRVQLSRISKLRGRDVLVFASDISKGNVPGADVDINYRDLMPLKDQIAVLNGTQLDVILETPGGSAEVAEDIVDLLRERFDGVSFIIPGWAKSAGTIMAMAGDEILMEPSSALGPIDAQITNRGKLFSAEALLEGLEKIKKESDEHGVLNRAYIPILQHISPGEIQRAKNSLEFAKNFGRTLALHLQVQELDEAWNK